MLIFMMFKNFFEWVFNKTHNFETNFYDNNKQYATKVSFVSHKKIAPHMQTLSSHKVS